MSAPHPEDLIDQYLAGELSPESAAEVRAYLEATPGRRGTMAGIRSAARGVDLGSRPSAEVMLEQLIARIEAAGPALEAKPDGMNVASASGRVLGTREFGGEFTGRPRRSWLYATLAVVTLAVGAWVAMTRGGWSAAVQPATQYATGIGERAVVTLRDGTRVTLAPRTALWVGTGERAVALEGEAYFDVRNKTARAPFLVRTGGVTTRVLGTAFTVRRYEADAETRVAVVSGKVVVSSSGARRFAGAGRPTSSTVVVSAGGVAVATDSSVSPLPENAAGTGPYTAWATGRLVFFEAPASEVLAALTRWYGYQFRLADPALASQQLTVGISTESSSAAFATLKVALDVELAFDGNVVTVSPRRAARVAPRATPRAPEGRDVFSPRTNEVGR